jgi:hypothetical protein
MSSLPLTLFRVSEKQVHLVTVGCYKQQMVGSFKPAFSERDQDNDRFPRNLVKRV